MLSIEVANGKSMCLSPQCASPFPSLARTKIDSCHTFTLTTTTTFVKSLPNTRQGLFESTGRDRMRMQKTDDISISLWKG